VGWDFGGEQVESVFEFGFCEGGEEGELLLVGGTVELDLLVEALGTLDLLFPVEWPVEDAREGEALRRHDVVEGLEALFIAEGFGMGVDGGEQGRVRPGLVVG
jgi:hypothetical protein